MAAKDLERPKTPTAPEEIVQAVRDRYGAIAAESTSCCGPQSTCCGDPATSIAERLGYTPSDLGLLPGGANLGLGCGAPVAALALEPGETVLDLGSGAGIDALLAAHAVGSGGHVIGVDMTPEMLAKARASAAAAGLAHVEFRQGRLEELPVDDATVDAVTSNCVINLVPDKAAVFREIHRVLRPGGRLVISDIVLDGPLPAALATDLVAYVGCVAGALERERYFRALADAGLGDIEVLKDVDFLAAVGNSLPPELEQVAAASGVTRDNVTGLVRSVTFRAWKR
jgi:SAM-dependent methyltransferase